MTQITRWGIMGLGKIAQKFAESLAYVPNAKIVAVASRSKEKAAEFAQKFGAAHHYESYEAMLDNPEVEVVYIATPHTLHHENTMACLHKGKAVLCEKPFAMNLAQVKEMTTLAKEKNLFLMEALWTKFLPSFKAVKQLIEEGKIGKIHTLQADFGFQAPYLPEERIFNPKLGGGSLLDIGIYPLFLAVSLLGKPDELTARAVFGETGVDNSCAMVLKYHSGSLAVLTASVVAYQSIEANIFGEKAAIKMNTPFHTPQTHIELKERFTTVRTLEVETEGNGYNYEAIEVGNCLRAGKVESEVMSHADSLLLMEMLDWVRLEAGICYD